MIPMQCPSCGQQLQIPDQYAGQTGKCQHCGAAITVPFASPAEHSQPNHSPPPIPESPQQAQKSKQKKSLAVCKDCGNEISKKAQTCPYCGAPRKRQSTQLSFTSGCLIVFVVLLLFGVVGTLLDSDTERTAVRQSHNSSTEKASNVKHKPRPSQQESKSEKPEDSVLDRLATGMSLQAVRELLGSEGKNKMVTGNRKAVEWYVQNKHLLATFENDTLINWDIEKAFTEAAAVNATESNAMTQSGGSSAQPQANVDSRHVLQVEALKIRQSSRSFTTVEIRMINTSPNELNAWLVRVELHDNAGNYLGQGIGMVQYLSAGSSKITEVIVEANADNVASWTVQIDGVVGESGLREDAKYSLELI